MKTTTKKPLKPLAQRTKVAAAKAARPVAIKQARKRARFPQADNVGIEIPVEQQAEADAAAQDIPVEQPAEAAAAPTAAVAGKARQIILAHCARPEGATAKELYAATGWNFASWSHQLKLIAKSTGWIGEIRKVDGTTRYFLIEPAQAEAA